MAVRKGGLGKGLDTLIPNKETKPVSRKKPEEKKQPQDVMKVSITKIEPNKDQPRKNFDQEALEELAASMKQFGVLQPLLVQEKDGYFEIVAGERRWRAAKLAGLTEIPVIVKKLSEQELMEISLIENIQREDLNPIEEALAYKSLIEEFGLKQEEMADKVGKSRTAITNTMRLLKLDERVQKMVIEGTISTGHARTLLAITDSEKQYQLAVKIAEEKLSVRDTEKLIKKLQAEKKNPADKKKINDQLDAIYRSLEQQLQKTLGTKVSINSKNEKSGKIEIEYYSQDELEKIIDLLKS